MEVFQVPKETSAPIGAPPPVMAYIFTHCTIAGYEVAPTELAENIGMAEQVQVSFSCESVTAKLGLAAPTTTPAHAQSAVWSALSFPASACLSTGCLTTVGLDVLSLSVAGPTPGQAPVVANAVWSLDKDPKWSDLSLGLLGMALGKGVLPSFEADLSTASVGGARVMTFNFGHCTVGSFTIGSLETPSGEGEVQTTFDCQSVTALVGGGPTVTRVSEACGANLVTNPGAEAGLGARSDSVVPVPGWTTTDSLTAVQYGWAAGDLSATAPGPPDRGKNYFFGGPSSETSTGTQVIALPASFSATKATYVLSGWLGGWDGQDDNATLFVTWEDAQGNPLGAAHRVGTGLPTGLLTSTQIGPVTETQRGGTTELLYRSVSGAVPVGTAMVKVVLVMHGPDGQDNDGLADNLSLVLTCA